MKKLFSLLTLALLTMSAWAATVSFDLTSGYSNGDAVTTIEKDGITLTFAKGSNSNEPKWYTTGTAVRLYGGNTLNIASNGDNITQVVFTFSGTGYTMNSTATSTVDSGAYSESGTTGTWTGNAQDFTITRGGSSGHARIQTIVVTIGGTSVAAPTFSQAAGNFEEPFNLTLTAEDGATIYYSYDNENWTEYTAPLPISETTTVYAKAVKDGVESAVASATYTLVEPVDPITTLAQANALEDNTEFTFEGDAVVTAQEGQYLWLRDASGYGLIYGNNLPTFTNGQVLSQNWTAKKTTYQGLVEYSNAANLTASGQTNPTLAAIQEITALDTAMINAYVQVKNVTGFTADGQNVTATLSDGTTMVMFNKFNKELPTGTGPFTVDGAVNIFKGELQLYILKIEGFTPQVHNVNNIAEAYALSENSTFTMYNDVVVTYQNGNRLWIRDTEDASGMIYGDLEATFNNGDVLSDGWSATYAVYNNLPEFTEPVDVAASGDTRDANPFERTAITNANVNEYIVMRGLTILADQSNAKRFYNEADSLVFFNTFNVETPTIEEGATYDVTGIVTIYYGKPQVYITEMVKVSGPIVVAAPVLPESCGFEEDYTVEITAEDGATIMFSYDNETWTEYTEPLYLTETTTVYAKAVKDGVESEVVSATYTLVVPAEKVTYELVTNYADLADGDKIIIVNANEAGEAFALAGIKTNNFAAVAVTVEDDMTVTTSEANVITLEANGDNWNLKTADGYIYAASNSKNYMKLEAEADDNALAEITVNADTTTIVFQGANSHNTMRFNPNNGDPMFSCYLPDAAIKNPVYIYKVKGEEPEGLRGDVDLNGEVGIADATLLIDLLLSASEAPNTADANLDGEIGIADVTSIIDYLLSGNWPE